MEKFDTLRSEQHFLPTIERWDDDDIWIATEGEKNVVTNAPSGKKQAKEH